MTNKELKAWNKEKEIIEIMIKKYCHKKHRTKKDNLCEECNELLEYSLFRLEKCPFKRNKKFCNFCKVHCYNKDMREKIKKVMRYSGPRLIFSHPIFVFKHLIQKIKQK